MSKNNDVTLTKLAGALVVSLLKRPEPHIPKAVIDNYSKFFNFYMLFLFHYFNLDEGDSYKTLKKQVNIDAQDLRLSATWCTSDINYLFTPFSIIWAFTNVDLPDLEPLVDMDARKIVTCQMLLISMKTFSEIKDARYEEAQMLHNAAEKTFALLTSPK